MILLVFEKYEEKERKKEEKNTDREFLLSGRKGQVNIFFFSLRSNNYFFQILLDRITKVS